MDIVDALKAVGLVAGGGGLAAAGQYFAVKAMKRKDARANAEQADDIEEIKSARKKATKEEEWWEQALRELKESNYQLKIELQSQAQAALLQRTLANDEMMQARQQQFADMQALADVMKNLQSEILLNKANLTRMVQQVRDIREGRLDPLNASTRSIDQL